MLETFGYRLGRPDDAPEVVVGKEGLRVLVFVAVQVDERLELPSAEGFQEPGFSDLPRPLQNERLAPRIVLPIDQFLVEGSFHDSASRAGE